MIYLFPLIRFVKGRKKIQKSFKKCLTFQALGCIIKVQKKERAGEKPAKVKIMMFYRRSIVSEYRDIQVALEMDAPITAMENIGRMGKAINVAFIEDAISIIEMQLLTNILVKARHKVYLAIIAEYGRGC